MLRPFVLTHSKQSASTEAPLNYGTHLPQLFVISIDILPVLWWVCQSNVSSEVMGAYLFHEGERITGTLIVQQVRDVGVSTIGITALTKCSVAALR